MNFMKLCDLCDLFSQDERGERGVSRYFTSRIIDLEDTEKKET